MRRPLIILSVFILLGLSVYTGILLYANYSASSPQANVKTWQKSLESIQQALKLDPANPEYLSSEARLYRYKAFSFKPESEQSNAANREALVRYQHLLTLRPSWALYWGSIVSIKYDLWEYDEVMKAALQNAARLAPWFKTNQHIILRAGFHGWPFIDNETKDVINKTLERAMQLQPEETMRFALEQGFGDRMVLYLEKDEELKGVYEKELKKMKKERKKF